MAYFLAMPHHVLFSRNKMHIEVKKPFSQKKSESIGVNGNSSLQLIAAASLVPTSQNLIDSAMAFPS